MRASILLAATASLAISACGQATDETIPENTATEVTTLDNAMDAATADPDAPVTAEDAAVPQGAQAFVNSMAAGDMFEIESSKLAATMAKSKEVKDFAAMMVKDHTDSSAKLKALTAALTPPIAVSPMLDPAQEADMAALRSAGAQFDQLYLRQQTAAHEKALALLQGYGANATVPELKTFATQLIPKIEEHLTKVRAIKP